MVKSDRAVKETKKKTKKIRRSNLPEINAGKRPPPQNLEKDSCGGQ